MQEAIIHPQDTTQDTTVPTSERFRSYSPNEVFFCPEESQFYSQCLEKMVLNACTSDERVIEFGTGDGSPVISALLKTRFTGMIHGYELSPSAAEMARTRVQQYQLEPQYVIHNRCFFEGLQATAAQILIANPPYIPAPDDDICLPALHGGVDGATITKRLLETDCAQVLLMISAYSNPIETVEWAIAQNYAITNFMVTPLQFGYYSSEPKVKDWIIELRKHGKAFYSPNIYFLAGVLFEKRDRAQMDLSNELLKVMTAL